MGIIANLFMLLNAKKINDIIKQASNEPELKDKMNKIQRDLANLQKSVENDPLLKKYRLPKEKRRK